MIKEYNDEKLIYFTPPDFILMDVKRVFKKMKLKIEAERISGNFWEISGSKEGLKAIISLSYEKKVFFPFITCGSIPVSRLRRRLVGEEDQIDKFRWNYKLSLLRFGG